MRFAVLAATIAAVVGLETVAPEVPSPKEYKKASYYRRVKDPNVRSRYKAAVDKCKGHSSEKKRYECFKRNWNLFKPHRQNKLNDLRARTHRACWKFKNNILKRAKCFDRYIKDYKGELAKGLLADDVEHKPTTQLHQAHEEVEENQRQHIERAFQQAVEGPDADEDDDALLEMDHVNERELSSASSTDSEASSSSSEDTSDDNNHRAGPITSKKLGSGERRAARKERLAVPRPGQAAPVAAVKK
jgi:hypothetical protein